MSGSEVIMCGSFFRHTRKKEVPLIFWHNFNLGFHLIWSPSPQCFLFFGVQLTFLFKKGTIFGEHFRPLCCVSVHQQTIKEWFFYLFFSRTDCISRQGLHVVPYRTVKPRKQPAFFVTKNWQFDHRTCPSVRQFGWGGERTFLHLSVDYTICFPSKNTYLIELNLEMLSQKKKMN